MKCPEGTPPVSDAGTFTFVDVPRSRLDASAAFHLEDIRPPGVVRAFFTTVIPVSDALVASNSTENVEVQLPVCCGPLFPRTDDAIGGARLAELLDSSVAPGLTESSLTLNGWMLGRVVDADGRGVAGARVETDAALQERVFLPSDDFRSAAGTTTASHGMFVYVGDGIKTPRTLRLNVYGAPAEYGEREVVFDPRYLLQIVLRPSP